MIPARSMGILNSLLYFVIMTIMPLMYCIDMYALKELVLLEMDIIVAMTFFIMLRIIQTGILMRCQEINFLTSFFDC